MNIKKILIIILIFILSILIAPAIYGIGVGLWVEEVDFYPKLNENFKAFVNNNAGYDAQIKISAGGSLAEYITFSDEYLDVPAGGTAHFTFNLKLPESIPPGRNRINIGAEDVTSLTGGGISAKTAVFMGFYVRAPYPGKYIETGFSVENIEKDQTANFNINIISRGNETINKIGGIIEIFNKDTKIATLITEPETNIKPGESRTIQTKWDSTGQSVGEYNAKATINYDGEEITREAKFKIGTLLVKIINYTKEFYKDEINQFDIEIESFWNTEINGIYGEVEINEQKIRTLDTNLGAWSKTKITAHLDTHNLDLGEHTAKIKVYYADKIAEETAKITVLPKRERIIELPSKVPSTTILLAAIIILLVIGNIILVLHYLKHGKNSKKAEKTKKVKKK